MAKRIILILIILIIITVFFIYFNVNNSVNVYLDGENISVKTTAIENGNIDKINNEIINLTSDIMNNTSSNITTLKEGIYQICYNNGIENPKITIDSSIGKNQIPVIVKVEGKSMLPTLKSGQKVLINKTHDLHVGDIVTANSKDYGPIIKRVEQIDGSQVHLVSDNKNITYEYINNELYKVEGVRTWVDISDINGVVIS
ncbi:MAG: peptidase S24 [Methanobrevibacter sp.]|nr:peptidase S24 [Methanobrevibacter sp.]